ncbi:MAG: substrate-binding domain-containing protein [Hyphomicrobiales bacterium]|nr:substrate-binding domain-containing protein [Hyphomicrobiales bacterium]
MAVYAIAEHLIDRGYRRFGYISTTDEHETREKRARLRSQGIYQAIDDSQLPHPIRISVPDPLNIPECGVIAADFVMAHPEIDAAICANEIIGVGVIVELQSRGRRVPDDVGVVGIGDANFAALVQPGLTTVHFPGYEIGRRAIQLILSRLNDQHPQDDCIDVGFEVIERGSTRPARASVG